MKYKMEDMTHSNSAFLDEGDLVDTTRVPNITAEGMLRAPRTMCWKLHPTESYRHLLDCGHMVVTDSTKPCGNNCRPSSNIKHPAPGDSFECRVCIDKAHTAVFVPKKRAPRASLPTATSTRVQTRDQDNMDLDLSHQGPVEDDYKIESKVTFDPDLYLGESPIQKSSTAKSAEDIAKEKEEHHHLFSEAPDDDDDADAEKGEVHCICETPLDSEMLPCSHCSGYFHPACIGHKLTSRQFAIFETNQKPFYCLNCKDDRIEANSRATQSKKAAKAAKAKPAKPAKKPRKLQKKTVASAAKPRGVHKTRAATKADKQLNYVIMDDDTMVSVRNPKSRRNPDQRSKAIAKTGKDQGGDAAKKATPNGPPKNRFALTANKHNK